MKKMIFIVEKTGNGFSAYATDFPIYTVGDNMQHLKNNMLDAANTWLNLKSMPEITDSQIDVQLDIPQFFSFYKEINAKAISKRIGMNETLLSQYVNGIKKPSNKQTARILQGIKSLGQELTNLELV